MYLLYVLESMFELFDPLMSLLNPYLTTAFAHHYNLGESTYIFRGCRCGFKILFYFLMKFL